MSSFRNLSPFWGTALVLVALAGCGKSGPEVVPVSGTLTYKGKAVPDALMYFEPQGGRQSWAQTDAQGRFKVNYDKHQDGALVGKHKVWLEYKPANQAEPGLPPPPPKELRVVFEKYNFQNSKLEVTIESSTRELKLDLD